MKEREIIRILKSAISNINKNKSNEAISELQQLKISLENQIDKPIEKKVVRSIEEEEAAPEDMPDECN